MPPLAASADPRAARAAWRWRAALLGLLLLGLANGLVWMSVKPERWYPGQDSDEYHLLAGNLLEGRGYTRETAPPYQPALYREPGYSTFVAAVLGASGRSDDAVAVAQALLVGVAAVAAAALGRAAFGRPAIGLLGGALVAVAPDLGDHARYQMSEALFTPLVLVAALATFRAWRTGSAPGGLLAGLAWGLAGYVRVIAFPTAVMLAAGSLLLDRRAIRRRWQWVAVLLAAMLLVVAPWIARNGLAVGQPSYTGRSGMFLLPRGDKAAAPADKQGQWLSTAAWVVSYPFSSLVVPTSRMYREPFMWDGPLGDLELMDTTRSFSRYCQGATGIGGMDQCYLREGVRLIVSHPVQYLALTGLEVVRLTFYVYPSKLSVVRNWTVWAGLATIGVCLLVAARRRRGRTWLALAIAAYTLPSVVGDAQPRYGVPLVPFYALFAAAGVVWLAEGPARAGLRRLLGPRLPAVPGTADTSAPRGAPGASGRAAERTT